MLASVRETWEPETTARNLRPIREARERRGEPVAWAMEEALLGASGAKGAAPIEGAPPPGT